MSSARGRGAGYIAAIGVAVISGLLLKDASETPWILVALRAIWGLLLSLIAWIWSVATWNTNLQFWAVAAGAVLLFLAGAIVQRISSAPRSNLRSSSTRREPGELTADELHVLKVISRQGTAWHTFSDVLNADSLSDLRVRAALDALMSETSLLEAKPDPLHGLRVRLSTDGTKLALERGWDQPWRPSW